MFSWLKSVLKPAAPPRDALGDRGENRAARHLQGLGYKIIVRNFRCPQGEIDIVARDGGTLVFVEVKTRAYNEPTPENQVGQEKQQQVIRVARIYLSRYGTPQPPARFDVIAVVWPEGGEPEIRHTMGAF